jgi:trehalose 6-phosphate phosphatase
MQFLPALNPRDTALFLDFDGTLAELAAQPDAVRVPARLVPLLGHLSEYLQGALALVTGRRLAELDALLSPLRLPAAAEHGAVRRSADGLQLSVPAPDLQAVTRVARALARQHAGLQVELKTAAVALHYRQAPALESLCLQHLSRAVMSTPGVELLHGKCVIEVKPLGVSKGSAIAAFMREPPFAGRTPWFAGDDVTDEAGFAWVQAAGGQGLKVGTGPSLARHRCASPQALRDWLSAHLTTSHSPP